ncbi:MAG: proline iminopeptidase-family hydrolase [Saprospiraceae bacterium]
MQKTIWRTFLTILLLASMLLSGIVLIPRTYSVLEFVERPETQYWDLPTGSRIGYTFRSALDTNQLAPIIYLHGGPGGLITEDIIASLLPFNQAGHDLYLYDQIGSGHSARLENINAYSPQRHEADLAAIIEQIDAPKVILIGHSWGAVLATRYLATHPERLAKVILTGPGPILPINRALLSEKAPDSLNLKAPTFSNQQANQDAYNLRSKAILYYAHFFGKKLASDREADAFYTHLNNALKKSTVRDVSKLESAIGGGGYYTHIMTLKQLNQVNDQRKELKKSQVPVLILRGQYDNQPWGYCAEYLELLPNLQFQIVKNAGHSIAKEQTDIYTNSILNFLTQ